MSMLNIEIIDTQESDALNAVSLSEYAAGSTCTCTCCCCGSGGNGK